MFKKIYIEITNSCNLSCPFCHRHRRGQGYITVDQFQTLLAKIHNHTGCIALHVLGEPLLHPELPELLDMARHYGLIVHLTTNGTLLDRYREALLAAPALKQVNISVHSLGFLPREKAEPCLVVITQFCKSASQAASMHISLRFWNHAEAAMEQNNWLLQVITSSLSLPPIAAADLQSGQGIALMPQVYLNPEQPFAWPDLNGPILGTRGHCRGLQDHIAILADGTVVPCCLDADGAISLGNLLSNSLESIMASSRWARMQQGMRDQYLVETLCQRCHYRLRFSAKGG